MSEEFGADSLNADLTGDLTSDTADGDALADDIFADSLGTTEDDAASADPAEADIVTVEDEPETSTQNDTPAVDPLGTGGDEVEADGNWHVDVNLDGQQFDGGIATIDADGDGLDDTSVANVVNEAGELESTYYIDETGDGIADQVLTTDAEGNVTEFQQYDAQAGEFVEAEFTGEMGEEGPQVADSAGQPQTLPADDTQTDTEAADTEATDESATADDAAEPTPVDPTDGATPTDETTVPTDETTDPTVPAEGDTSVGTPVGDAYIADNSIGAPDAEHMADFQEDLDSGMVNTDIASAPDESSYDLNFDGAEDAAFTSNDDGMSGYMAVDNDGDGQADQVVVTELLAGEEILTDEVQANFVLNPDTGAWENIPVQGQG